jgi:uncharacterized membrane protein
VSGKIPTIFNIVLMLLMIGGSLAVWDSLPERMPLHFGIDGRPDSWGAKSILSWFMLPGIATGLTFLMYGIAAMIIRRPDFINMPDQKKFLDLPAASKKNVLSALQVLLYWVGVMLNVIFVLVQFGSYRAAIGKPMPGLILTAVLIGIVTSPMLAVVALLRMQSLIDAGFRK